MGITAKVWILSDVDVARCRRDPKHADSLFHAANDSVLIWGARGLHAILDRLLAADIGLERVDASDPTYVLGSAALAALLARPDPAIAESLTNPESPEVNAWSSASVLDLVKRARRAGCGIAYCIYEDW